MEDVLKQDEYYIDQDPVSPSASTITEYFTRSLPDLRNESFDDDEMELQDNGDANNIEMKAGSQKSDAQLELTEEQALASLKYFTSTVSRTNLLSKAHGDDLNVISDLLQEKEKDLEMAARIGQSLLQRNKNLIVQIESMEDYLHSATERESQIRHEMQLKNDLMKKVIHDQDELEQRQFNYSSNDSNDSYSMDGSCKDESIVLLQKKCQKLEHENSDLFAEAINLRSMTFDEEDKEQQLVMDCIKQLAEAKHQITNLTDEIAMKFEDNVHQQDEITRLITTVVELQNKHKELSWENGELQQQLDMSQQDQQCLRSQVLDLQRKFGECYEMLQENQVEVKTLKSKVEVSDFRSWHSVGSSSGFYQDSLALELEESLHSDTSSQGEKISHASKVMGTVKMANRFLEHHDPTHRSVSERESPAANIAIGSEYGGSLSVNTADNWSDSASQAPSHTSSDTTARRQKRGYGGPERLQIVKPLEGSNTLHHWQELASQTARDGLINLAVNPDSPRTDDATEDDAVRLSDLDDDIFDDEIGSDGRGAKMKSSTPKINITEPSTEDKQKEFNDAHTALPLSKSKEGKLRPRPKKATAKKAPQAVKPRTIVTRNATILTSLREGRELLNSKDGGGRSKTEVIDMIANAMSKVNLEAKTGQRILESLSSSPPKAGRSSNKSSPTRKTTNYPGMPKVTRLLEKITPTPGDDGDAIVPSIMLQDAMRKKQESGSSTTSSMLSSSSSKLLSGFFAASTNSAPHQASLVASATERSEQNSAETITARPMLTRSHSSGDLGSFTRGSLAGVTFPTGGIMGRMRRDSGGINLLAMQNDVMGDAASPGLLRKTSSSSGNLVDLVRNADIQPLSSTHHVGSTEVATIAASGGGFFRNFFRGATPNEPAVPSTVNPSASKPHVTESVGKGLKNLGRAFAQDDFGGMGMMSIFASPKRKDSGN